MHDSDNSPSLLGTALAVGVIVAGIVAGASTGALQVAAFVSMIGMLGGIALNSYVESREREIKQEWPEQPVARVEVFQALTPEPERSWVETLERAEPEGRYH